MSEPPTNLDQWASDARTAIHRMMEAVTPDDRKNLREITGINPDDYALLKCPEKLWTLHKIEGVNDPFVYCGNGQLILLQSLGTEHCGTESVREESL